MKKLNIILATVALGVTSNVNAALLERLGGLAYYDDEADLTWLADANPVGRKAVGGANYWVSTLDVSGVMGWRLPVAQLSDQTCSAPDVKGFSAGFNCTGSEMGNLFYNVLGGISGSNIADIHNSNYDLFSNIQSRGPSTGINYFTNTTTAISNSYSNAITFSFEDGIQSYTYRNNHRFIWAVHDGDVAPAVPIPAAIWLFGSGLLGLVAVARRKANA